MKLILVGKCSKHENHGPANVIRCLLDEFNRLNVETVPILLNEECGKKRFLFKTVHTLLHERNCMVNVHTSGFLIPLLVWLLSRINRTNKYFLTIHGIYKIDAALNGTLSKGYVKLENFLYRRFPNLVCVSPMLKNDIQQLFRRNNQIFVIPNGTNAGSSHTFDNTAINRRIIKFIFLGGLKSEKGITESLQLIAYLANKKGLQVCLTIYGSEEGIYNQAWLAAETQELGIKQMVQFSGNETDKQKLYDCIAASDFQLCLSKYDTFNVAIAESLVLGCPCICTNKCGGAYLIEQNENGITVDLSRTDAFENIYDYVCSFYKDTSKRLHIYEKRAQYQKALSWKEVCMSYLQLTEERV